MTNQRDNQMLQDSLCVFAKDHPKPGYYLSKKTSRNKTEFTLCYITNAMQSIFPCMMKQFNVIMSVSSLCEYFKHMLKHYCPEKQKPMLLSPDGDLYEVFINLSTNVAMCINHYISPDIDIRKSKTIYVTLENEKKMASSHIMDKCSICLDDISSKKFSLECRHIFHKDCVILLLTKSEYKQLRCPYCRKFLDEDKLRFTLLGTTKKDTNTPKETFFQRLQQPATERARSFYSLLSIILDEDKLQFTLLGTTKKDMNTPKETFPQRFQQPATERVDSFYYSLPMILDEEMLLFALLASTKIDIYTPKETFYLPQREEQPVKGRSRSRMYEG